MKINAFAKINLGLDVIGKRKDGYHELCMIMQTVKLYDVIDISCENIVSDEFIFLEDYGKIHIECTDKDIPCDERNLVYKAALAFLKYSNKKADILINIEKNIPYGAGLGGGSSDAAAVIEALNVLLNTGFSKKELVEIAVKVGADVPFFIFKNTCLAEGIGEILTPVKLCRELKLLLVKPPFGASTPVIYKNLVLDENTHHPDICVLKSALEKGDVENIYKNIVNTLEGVAFKLHPEILNIKEELISLGANVALMSGSGSSVFAIFEDDEKRKSAYDKMKKKYDEVYLTTTLNNV